MKIYLEEKIGNPNLFTGRKTELNYFTNWIARIKQKRSKSTAILSRRKTGKTALLQRLYNLTFAKDNGVIPFYYEIKEGKQWAVEFCQDFYLTFIFQYIAFKTRNIDYVQLSQQNYKTFADAKQADLEIGGYLGYDISRVEQLVQNKQTGLLWAAVRDTPWTLAARRQEYIVQIIDEFQFLNSEIYWDEARTNHANDFAAGYLSTAEYKNAPLLISGSWVGWLMNDLTSMLPGRFQTYHLVDMPLDEAIEIVYRYSLLEDIEVTEETAYLIAGLTEGNPFYISGLFQSRYSNKNFKTKNGVLETLQFETLDKDGGIRGTWLEYINAALPRINEKHAKNIVLYLSKHRDRLISRKQLKQALNLDMSDHELKKKLNALLRCDIIEENYFKYQGVQDNIFDKIFRSEYGDDIDEFVPEGANNEYKALFETLLKKYKSLSGEHNRYKGAYAEFVIIQHLKFEAANNNTAYKLMMHNLPADFDFVAYKTVWAYHSPPLHKFEFQIDIFAQAESSATPPPYSLIGEVKHRQTTKFSLAEAKDFMTKAQELIQLEQLNLEADEQVKNYLLFVFSSAGFQPDALAYFKANGMAWSDDKRWLDSIKK